MCRMRGILKKPEMTFEETIERLNNYTWSSDKNGLDAVRFILNELGNPQKALKFVHVAGTNGKGSVCAMTERILREAGFSTGLYISPHLEDIRERIQINGVPVSREAFNEAASRVMDVAVRFGLVPSQYVVLTSSAMLCFAKYACDIVVLEVGLGGGRDATNVIDPPEVSVICNIGLDHTRQLGDSIEKIAEVKCGIIKPGSYTAAYENRNEVLDIIRKNCEKARCPIYYSKDEVLKYPIALHGPYQKKNAATVLAVIHALRDRGWKIPEEAVRDGLGKVFWPARFEILNEEPLFILDGGHNSQCAEAVVEALDEYYPHEKSVFLMGMLKDKDVESTLDVICGRASHVVCLTPGSLRALTAKELSEKVQSRGIETDVIDDGPEMVDEGIRRAIQHGGIVVAFGSLYLAGDIRKAYTCGSYKKV